MRTMADLVRDQNPLIFPPHANVQDAARQMHARRLGAVLVAEDDRRLVGIFTGRDAIARILATGRDPSATTLAEVMTPSPTTLSLRHTVIEALRLMQDVHCRHLPVVHDGRIVGIVSRGDFTGMERDRLDEETGLWERIA